MQQCNSSTKYICLFSILTWIKKIYFLKKKIRWILFFIHVPWININKKNRCNNYIQILKNKIFFLTFYFYNNFLLLLIFFHFFGFKENLIKTRSPLKNIYSTLPVGNSKTRKRHVVLDKWVLVVRALLETRKRLPYVAYWSAINYGIKCIFFFRI